MKKNVVLGMIVLGLLVVPALAEPTFSGSFSYGFHYDPEADDTKKIFEEGDHDASIDFTAAISEYTSLSAKMDGDSGGNVEVDHMILSQDVTGALGVDGPLGFSYKVGKQNYAPPDYSHFKDPGAEVGVQVSGSMDEVLVQHDLDGDTATPDVWVVTKADKLYTTTTQVVDASGNPVVDSAGNPVYLTKPRGSDANEIGLVLTFDLLDGTAMLDAAVYPKSFMDDNDDTMELGITLSGKAGPAEYAVYYAKSEEFAYVDSDGDTIDGDGDVVGANLKLTFGDFVATVLGEYDLDEGQEAALAAISAGYSIAGLTATVGADLAKIGIAKEDNGNVEWEAMDNLDVDLDLGYTIAGFETNVEFRSSLDDFSPNSSAKLTAAYTLGDLVLYGAAKMGTFKDFEVKDDLTYEAGLTYTLDNVAFNVGYTNGSDYKAYYDSPDHKKGVYLNITTSF